jgi:hypothetical protein
MQCIYLLKTRFSSVPVMANRMKTLLAALVAVAVPQMGERVAMMRKTLRSFRFKATVEKKTPPPNG